MSFHEPRHGLDLTQGLLSSGEVLLALTRPGSLPINVNESFAWIYVGAGSGTDFLPIRKLCHTHIHHTSNTIQILVNGLISIYISQLSNNGLIRNKNKKT